MNIKSERPKMNIKMTFAFMEIESKENEKWWKMNTHRCSDSVLGKPCPMYIAALHHISFSLTSYNSHLTSLIFFMELI